MATSKNPGDSGPGDSGTEVLEMLRRLQEQVERLAEAAGLGAKEVGRVAVSAEDARGSAEVAAKAASRIEERVGDVARAQADGAGGVQRIAESVRELAERQNEGVAHIKEGLEIYKRGAAEKDAEAVTRETRRSLHERRSKAFWAQGGGTHYPDIIEWYPPSGATPAMMDTIDARNEMRERMYYALVFILRVRMGFEAPNVTPAHFASWHGQTVDVALRFLGVHGLLLAENYDDPLLLRPDGTTFYDDIVGYVEVKLKGEDPRERKPPYDVSKTEVRVARRFFDAAVGGVQRYTAKADLFKKVHDQLHRRGTPPRPAA